MAREAAGGDAARLLFKKRMFRETDEAISEPIFISLSFVQAQHDYLEVCFRKQTSSATNSMLASNTGLSTWCRVLHRTVQRLQQCVVVECCYMYAILQGNYPVVMEDAAQMAALQIHAEYGPTLLDNAEGMEAAIERFITNQVALNV